jgi:hypothetical protein
MAALRIFRPLRSLLVFLLLCIGLSVHAQLDNVYVYGTVKDYNTSKKLDGVTVTVFKDGTKFASVVTSANGKYEYNLDYGSDYKLLFEKPGMVSKNVTINTSSIPEEERAGGLAMNVEMTLFADIPGINYDILKQPIGKSKYDPTTHMLAWDLEYTENMRAELDRLQKEYDEKKKREANKEEEFAKLMQQGNAAMSSKDYNKAVQSFTDALGLKAGDPIATAKLSDAQIKLNELAQAEAQQKKYNDLIKEADGLFGKKSYEEAKAKYTAAAAVKDQETYPKQKIKECDAFIADLAAKAEAEKKAKELDDKYNAAVAAGDAAFKAAKYEDAKAKFTEAAGLKPAEKYPPQQLAAIAAKLDELAKKAEADKKAAELEAAYQAAIKAGDDAFKSAKYDQAKAKYNEALGVKPKEKYPTDQLAAIDKKLAELAAKAEADKKAAEQEAAYQAAITAADAAFKAANYDEAKAKYNEALGVKPKEKYPTDQLAAIEQKLKDLAAKAEADKKAAELDAAYQAAITAADAAFQGQQYDDAKDKYNEALKLKPKEKYPADQLAAIDKKLADMAAKAAADKKAAELDAKYQALVDKAEELFTAGKYTDSKAKFQEALEVKPDEARPKERIVEIDAKLAELARQAEDQKKQAELDAKYNALIASADKKFDAKKNSDALQDYTDASALKPDEQYPKDRIAAINELLDAKAKEQAEKDRLAREQREKDEQYKDLIAQADKDFKAKDYTAATNGYNSALGVKPDEQYPADQIKAIQELLAQQAAADSAKAAQAEADRLRQEEAARLKAEAERNKARQDSIDAAERQRLADEEARRRAAAEADSLKAELDKAAREREAQQALDDQYNKVILDADKAMADKDYPGARGLYSQALDIKPKESYPQVKIDQIDKLLEQEEQARQAREQAKQQEQEAAPPPPVVSSTDNRKEQEAELFMREAREREEAEKYERIKRLKASVQQQEEDHAAKAQERHADARKHSQGQLEEGAGLYEGSQAMRKKNAEELAALQAAWEKQQQELRDRGVQESGKAKAAADALEDERRQQVETRRDAHADRVKDADEQAEEWSAWKEDQARKGKERSDAARNQLLDEAGRMEAMQQRGNALVEGQRQDVARQKESQEARLQQLQSGANGRVSQEREKIQGITPNQQRPYSQYNRNDLASQYPQGVTEESYTEGNKVIIRRVVVQGNKADEYSKVIAKWGTFYFKNGQSISESIWSINTGD